MLIGYARASTADEKLDLQLDALKNAGCGQVFTDKVSGTTNTKNGLEEALKYAREGDTLVVLKLDRLGQPLKGLLELSKSLQQRGIQFKSITDDIDTSTSAGQSFFNVMSALALMERELIRERTRAGLSAARASGRLGGRKPKMDESMIAVARKLLETGAPALDVAKNLGVSRATLYRAIS